SPMGGPLIRMLPFAAQIHTLVTAGHARLLAQPSLLTMSGETANFLAGGEIPVAIPQDGGRVLVEWKPYGVMLEVTPIVDTQGRVEVAIVAEASTLDWENGIRLNNLLIPALGVRRTESRLRINDGE